MCSVPAASSDDLPEAGAPEAEIEITEEMIDAGAAILWNDAFLNLDPSSCREFAREILKVALKKRHGKICQVPRQDASLHNCDPRDELHPMHAEMRSCLSVPRFRS